MILYLDHQEILGELGSVVWAVGAVEGQGCRVAHMFAQALGMSSCKKKKERKEKNERQEKRGKRNK